MMPSHLWAMVRLLLCTPTSAACKNNESTSLRCDGLVKSRFNASLLVCAAIRPSHCCTSASWHAMSVCKMQYDAKLWKLTNSSSVIPSVKFTASYIKCIYLELWSLLVVCLLLSPFLLTVIPYGIDSSTATSWQLDCSNSKEEAMCICYNTWSPL